MDTVKEALTIPRLTLLASADCLIQTGRAHLADLVKNCTAKYEYSIQYVERNPAADLFFSPTPAKPVPEAEAHVHFQVKGWFLKNLHASQVTGRELDEVHSAVGKSSLIADKPDNGPPIVFWFENQNLKHTPERTLAAGKFEGWIDRIVQDKLQLRRQHRMRTAFEISRMNVSGTPIQKLLQEQKDACIRAEQQAEHEAQANARREALAAASTEAARRREREARSSGTDVFTPRMLFEVPQEELPLEQVLQKVFDAADEDKEGKLPHKEVADLLLASPLGLQRWDLLLLLASAAHEDRQGFIHYREFVEQAPGVIRTLRERRKAAVGTNLCHVTDEAVQLCYKDELEDAWRIMRDIFEAADPSAAATGKLPRGVFLECLRSRPERFSSMEVTLLMQMAPTDDNGRVSFYSFASMLRILRRESINHAVLETDRNALREEILLALQKMGCSDESVLPLWVFRDVLAGTQLCLSRMQIHALLCMLVFDRFGVVHCAQFLEVVCAVVPQLYDCHVFMDRAERIAKEAADAAARAEIEELQGLTGGKSRRKQSTKETDAHKGDGFEDSEQGDAPDKETVEKTLIHLFTVIDDKRRGVIPVQTFISAMRYWATGAGSSQQAASRYSPAQLLQPSGAPSGRPGSPSGAGGTGAGLPGPSLSLARPASAAGLEPKGFGPGGPQGPSGLQSGPAGSAAAAAERRYADVVASCRLSVEEITGLLAEVDVDDQRQEVAYQEHIKTWIPIVFEMRKSPVFHQLIHSHVDAIVWQDSDAVPPGLESDAGESEAAPFNDKHLARSEA
ncbi:conserved hypothetical protein [Neospora caninum Liverpool]|uniref:EF-hand domain-containing protein n=1 Tax=Neospora caninum (strain Liverpool) TaxID=572307 RepID=F0VQH8_NEOCL|nr:conserved hypothetical protein [Neospora caninum Liverpool]CBZ55975.1 conserved hypothetical protein [Neospora caninum Liverpool]CEL70721.1 TPA: hypothetical protein BN1204_064010 [Neospora caninum Liverpool]|eukprot:XP_003886001.1 conserved hypothetical protein [Neospora caninum Liverpool]